MNWFEWLNQAIRSGWTMILYIAGGEQESGRMKFQRLLDEGHLDIIQPDLARCGGLTDLSRNIQ